MRRKIGRSISTGIFREFRLAALVILSMLLILSLSSCVNQKAPIAVQVAGEATNLGDTQALADFWDTYDSYIVAADREWTIWQEYNEGLDKRDAVSDEATGLTTREQERMRKLNQEGLDVVAEQQKILNRIRQAVYEQSPIVSQLQGNVTRITDPTKKSLAQQIADKLREINNLKVEALSLHNKDLGYSEEYFRDYLFVAEGKMTMEEANKRTEKRNEHIEENSARIDEAWNAIDALRGEVSDLAEKLRNL